MYQKKKTVNYTDCPLRLSLDILQGSWKAWLIIEIHRGVSRPKDLFKKIPLAPKRSLVKQLTELEQQGIVQKTIYPVIPLRVEYYLTDAGNDLLYILEDLERWGNRHRPVM